jgi:predicted N-acetyltransferase YhbS
LAPLREHARLVEVVVGWWHEGFLQAQGLTRAEAAAALRERLGPAALPQTFVALDGTRPCGTMSLLLDEHPLRAGARCCLAGLYVPPELRGRGIGTWLCTQALRSAHELGHAELMLFTPDAEAFYAARGWRLDTHAAVSTSHGLAWSAVMTAPTGLVLDQPLAA